MLEHDFRLIKVKYGSIDIYELHRVFYENNSIKFIERNPATLVGNNAKVILEDVDLMLDGLHKTTLIIPSWNKNIEGL